MEIYAVHPQFELKNHKTNLHIFETSGGLHEWVHQSSKHAKVVYNYTDFGLLRLRLNVFLRRCLLKSSALKTAKWSACLRGFYLALAAFSFALYLYVASLTHRRKMDFL